MLAQITTVGAAFWFLSLNGRRIQAQKAKHNEFIKSGLKS